MLVPRRASTLRTAVLATVVATLFTVTGCGSEATAWGPAPAAGTSAPADGGSAPTDGGAAPPGGGSALVHPGAPDCVVAAAGDIAGEKDYLTGAARTAQLILSAQPEKVLALGDLAYPDGTPEQFAAYYEPTWGAFKAITAPTPGNHEYNSDGKGYFDYFDVAPNYAFDVCGWHLVSIDPYAGMAEAAAFIAQEGAVAGDTPLLVYWHQPRFSSGSEHGSDPAQQPLWAAAVEAGAEIVLNGHDHNYERFEPMGVNGEARPDGTVEFVSGNGGHNLRSLGDRQAHSAAAISGTPGVLFLTLRADGYDWTYRDVEGATGDSGTRVLP